MSLVRKESATTTGTMFCELRGGSGTSAIARSSCLVALIQIQAVLVKVAVIVIAVALAIAVVICNCNSNLVTVVVVQQ